MIDPQSWSAAIISVTWFCLLVVMMVLISYSLWDDRPKLFVLAVIGILAWITITIHAIAVI